MINPKKAMNFNPGILEPKTKRPLPSQHSYIPKHKTEDVVCPNCGKDKLFSTDKPCPDCGYKTKSKDLSYTELNKGLSDVTDLIEQKKRMKSFIITEICKEANFINRIEKTASENNLTAEQQEKINAELDNSTLSFQELAHQLAPIVKTSVQNIYDYLLNEKSYFQYRHRIQ